MRVQITRNTGFFGMASPLEILKDGEVLTSISEKTTKEFVASEDTFTLQIKFFLMKSPVYTYTQEKDLLQLGIIMNPKLISMYIALFLVMFFIPVMLRSMAVTIFLIVLYIVFIVGRLNKAYLLKELE